MNRRFICLIIAIALMLPLVSYPVYGNDYAKEIDASFDSIEIHIGDKKILNHKEPFLYDGGLWVPLKDLAKGLDLDYKMNKGKKSVGLDSKGRLKIDGPNSKKIKVFQTGYEIQAKERIVDELRGVRSTNPTETEPSVRNIKVGIGNWAIFLDGQRLNMDVEPLFYNEDIYINIDTIAPYLYITPSYKNGVLNIDANGILAKDDYFSSIDNLLAFREGRNYLLDIQIDQLEKRKAVEESLRGIPYADLKNIKDVERYLNRHFDKIGELYVDIEASQSIGDWIYLDISFSRSDSRKWRKLERKEVEDWIWDIYTAILELYNDEGLLHGAIRNPNYSRYSSSSYKNYVYFDTRDKDLYFDFSKSQLKRDTRFNPIHLVEALEDRLNRYNRVRFEYSVDVSGDNVNLTVYPDSNSVEDWSLYTKMGYFKRLNWEIRRVYPDLTVNGTMVFPREDVEPIRFYFDNNRIRSADLLRETETYLNNRYGSFSYGEYDYELDFNIYEKDLYNLELIVEGDFTMEDGSEALDRLNDRVQNAISTIVSLWDMNISTKVLDKNGLIIWELDTYQDSVGIVYANPSEGEVVEGTKVHLYTDTPGADIYYTLDGSTPTRGNYRYTEPIIISRDLTINAFGYKEGMGEGPIASFRYTVVADDNMSYGLRDLTIDRGSLSPSFSRDVLDYEVNVDGNVDSITLTPYADEGSIEVDGEKVSSGQGKVINLREGRNAIAISVKENGKNERIYTINVYRGSSGGVDVEMKELLFSTTIVGVFKGRLASNYVRDFSGYRVQLLSKAGVEYDNVDVGSDGRFEIRGFDVDPISKIIGYKYKVYDGVGNLVLEDNLVVN